jgi:hypothetical protein
VNAHERVVDRAIEFAAVDDHVVVESENRLEAFRLAHNAGIATPAKRIEKKYPALPAILYVFGKCVGNPRCGKFRN